MGDQITAAPHPKAGWALLMKFGEREHLNASRDEGLLYMNPQGYFSQIEEDAVRRDPFEGTDQIHQPADIERLVISGPINEAGTIQEVVITPTTRLTSGVGGRSRNCSCYRHLGQGTKFNRSDEFIVGVSRKNLESSPVKIPFGSNKAIEEKSRYIGDY